MFIKRVLLAIFFTFVIGLATSTKSLAQDTVPPCLDGCVDDGGGNGGGNTDNGNGGGNTDNGNDGGNTDNGNGGGNTDNGNDGGNTDNGNGGGNTDNGNGGGNTDNGNGGGNTDNGNGGGNTDNGNGGGNTDNGNDGGNTDNGNDGGNTDNGNDGGNTDNDGPGDEDNGNADNEEGNGDDKDNNSGKEENKKSKEKLKAELLPLLYLDFDYYEQEVNLTPQSLLAPKQDRIDYYKFDPELSNLQFEDYRDGFRITNYYRLRWGLGGQVRWHYENADGIKDGLYAYVGIAPINGEEILTVRHIEDLSLAKNLPKVDKPPQQLREIEKWAVGDRLSYMNSGGVIYVAGVGYKFIGVGVTVVDEGQWRVNIERSSLNHAIVNVQNIDIDSTTVSMSAGPIRLGKSQIETQGQSFSFQFKLNSGVAQKAFEDILNGNIGGVQEFLIHNPNEDVVFVEDFEFNESGQLSHFFVGLPFLFNVFWGEGKFLGVSEQNLQVKGERVRTNYGVYRMANGYKFFGNDKDHSMIFYANQYSRIDKKKVQDQGHFGQFVFSFKRTNPSSRKFYKDIKKMSEMLSTEDELLVNIPKENNLGYMEIKVKIDLTEKLVNQLIERAKLEPKSDLIAESLNYLAENSMKPLSYFDEDNEWMDETESALETMIDSLVAMGEVKEADPKKFVKLFAQFGEAALVNPDTFKNLIRLSGSDHVVSYYLRGEKISQYSMYLSRQESGEYKATELKPEYTAKSKNKVNNLTIRKL